MKKFWKIWTTTILIALTWTFGIWARGNQLYALTTSYSSAQYSDCYDDVATNGGPSTVSTCSSWINMGTEHTYPSQKFIYRSTFMVSGGSSYTYKAGNTYIISAIVAINPKTPPIISYLQQSTHRLEGSTSTATSGLNASNIESFSIQYENTDNTYWYRVKISFTPKVDIKLIWFQTTYTYYDVYYDGADFSGYPFKIRDFQWYRIESITYTEGIGAIIDQNTQAINNQTTIINNTLNQDHDYNNNASENIEGQENIDDLNEAESDLFENLDFSGANTQVSINPYASSYIWEIVNALRAISSKIVLLMTSILGLGIIKMILNR